MRLSAFGKGFFVANECVRTQEMCRYAVSSDRCTGRIRFSFSDVRRQQLISRHLVLAE